MSNPLITGTVVLSLLGTLGPVTADAFTGGRGTRIAPVDAVVFEVVTRTAGSASEFWCGAADYARRALGAGWRARIYLVRGRAHGVTLERKSAVHFTLDPGAAGIVPIDPSFSLSALKVGDNMSLQQASTYCEKPPTLP